MPRSAIVGSELLMIQEMVYTSAPKGLKPGSSGFCTVAATQGMSPALIDRLELLSSYQPLAAATSREPSRSPVQFAHWRVSTAGRTRSVLSRVAINGLDYTRRPNKIAYHLVLDPAELPEYGPAWTMAQPGVMVEKWVDPARSLGPRKLALTASLPGAAVSCHRWGIVTGDQGWAGIMGEAFMLDPTRPAHLICLPETDPLPLLDEAIRLLPPRARWQVTFNTYFSELPAGLTCVWRCVTAGTRAASEAARAGGLTIDLTHPIGPAPDTPGAVAARQGRPVPPPEAPASSAGPQ
jgi:hypothetical protein